MQHFFWKKRHFLFMILISKEYSFYEQAEAESGNFLISAFKFVKNIIKNRRAGTETQEKPFCPSSIL